MYAVNEKQFLDLSKKGNLIPVYKEVLSDLETPVSAYYKLCHGSKYSLLLESVEGEEKINQYSFLGYEPQLILETKKNSVRIRRFDNGQESIENSTLIGSPLDVVASILDEYRFVPVAGLPRFCGGFVGYHSYDIVRFFEKLPEKTEDDLNMPDTLMALVKDFLIFEHRTQKIKIVSCVHIDEKVDEAMKICSYKKALSTIDSLLKKLDGNLNVKQDRQLPRSPKKLKIQSNLTEFEFKDMVNIVKQRIFEGEVIQVVLSQRFETDLETDPFNIYRSLRILNPSPYMYFLNFNGFCIVGASPEMLVRCDEGIIETRPIAGTRHRGSNDEEDRTLAEDLLNDKKEIAEHIMLVDLGRNDLGRVCESGSIEVSEFMNIEKYSHVMHIVSNVRGVLKKGKREIDVLKAVFPAGTLSGAPKIRAMEIIEELEKTKRGPYGGCIGYFSFSGNMDTCITIRTVLAYKQKAYVQAGAGIVADSDPEKEYWETVNKAKAAISAIEIAHGQ